jgi:succinate dehydrogenase/fumarate reductase cytochrome b subunit
VDVAHVMHVVHDMGPMAVIPLKAALVFPLAYHAAAGMRHLVSI